MRCDLAALNQQFRQSMFDIGTLDELTFEQSPTTPLGAWSLERNSSNDWQTVVISSGVWTTVDNDPPPSWSKN